MNGRRRARLVADGLLILVVISAAGGCGGDGGAETPTPVPSPTSANPSPTAARPTTTASPEGEVLDAYAKYWEVYADALRGRDATHLDQVMAGQRLDRALKEVQDLINQGRAVEVVVNSRPVVVTVDGDRAFVVDEYENQSHLIDPVTKQALEPTPVPGRTLRDRVTLQLVGDVWKVVETVREDAPR